LKVRARTFLFKRAHLIGALLLFFIFVFCGKSSAHDLEVDELTLWPTVPTGSLRGQILFDPAHTRDDDANIDLAAVQADIASFLGQNVRIRADDKLLSLNFEVRELYSVGGAVGGDSVMISAALPTTTQSISVIVGEGFEQLAVRVEGLSPEGTGITWGAALLPGGTTRPFSLPGYPSGVAGKSSFIEGTKPLDLVRRFVVLGFQHILPYGWDHLLFVFALTLASFSRKRPLLFELATFTVAHTVALGLGALDVIVVPPVVVEPLIALSIAAVALENLHSVESTLARVATVFAFGLIHGQGFAGALLEVGLSGEAFLVPLLSFNVGVEFGQICVVLLTLAVVSWLGRSEPRLKKATRLLCWGVAGVGFFVAVLRIFQGASGFTA
jgi:hypothetical protein